MERSSEIIEEFIKAFCHMDIESLAPFLEDNGTFIDLNKYQFLRKQNDHFAQLRLQGQLRLELMARSTNGSDQHRSMTLCFGSDNGSHIILSLHYDETTIHTINYTDCFSDAQGKYYYNSDKIFTFIEERQSYSEDFEYAKTKALLYRFSIDLYNFTNQCIPVSKLIEWYDPYSEHLDKISYDHLLRSKVFNELLDIPFKIKELKHIQSNLIVHRPFIASYQLIKEKPDELQRLFEEGIPSFEAYISPIYHGNKLLYCLDSNRNILIDLTELKVIFDIDKAYQEYTYQKIEDYDDDLTEDLNEEHNEEELGKIDIASSAKDIVISVNSHCINLPRRIKLQQYNTDAIYETLHNILFWTFQHQDLEKLKSVLSDQILYSGPDQKMLSGSFEILKYLEQRFIDQRYLNKKITVKAVRIINRYAIAADNPNHGIRGIYIKEEHDQYMVFFDYKDERITQLGVYSLFESSPMQLFDGTIDAGWIKEVIG